MEEGKFLSQDTPFNIEVQSTGDSAHPSKISVVTRYARFTSDIQSSAEGQLERWFTLETQPAFEVGMLQLNDGQPQVMLMQKRRKEGEPWRTKVPGGYQWGPLEAYASQKIVQDTGLQINYERCKELKSVIGHSEIITPIRLFYTFHWEKIGEPREGVRMLEVPLQQAIEMAGRGEIENDSSFSLLMWLWYLHTTGAL